MNVMKVVTILYIQKIENDHASVSRKRPCAVRERFCCLKRASRLDLEEARERDMVSSPEISSCRVCFSEWSAFPRIEPMAFWKKDSAGASDILRSKARSRDRFVSSMSCDASSPATFRAMVASVTGLGRVKKFCQGELTEAKPESRAMTEIPMTPIFSEVVSTMLEGAVGPIWLPLPRRYSPLDQKPKSQAAKLRNWSSQAHLNLPDPFPLKE